MAYNPRILAFADLQAHAMPEPSVNPDMRPIPRPKRRPRRLRAAPRPSLTIPEILAWADDHQERTGRWPKSHDRAVLANRNEKWCNINAALHAGARGLPGGTTLAKLLAEQRGARNHRDLPPLSEVQILAWADAWHIRTGRWPGPDLRQAIPEAPGEKWNCIDVALHTGGRGLPGGDSLARLLARKRQVRNIQNLPPLTEKQILGWARAHQARTGAWPTYYLGAVEEAPEESWKGINSALREGGRGLPGGSSLARLLAERLGIRNKVSVPDLTERQILDWADAFHKQQGTWPRVLSGPIAGAPGETWLAIDSALREGLRGLPGFDSLARLLQRKRGVRNKAATPKLSERLILRWAKEHLRRTGKWPNAKSGPVVAARGETWGAIERCLDTGGRGLPGGDSIARLRARHGKGE
jgi:hypothetical protein